MKEFFKKILLGKRYEKPMASAKTEQRKIGFQLNLKTGDTITSTVTVGETDEAKIYKLYETKLKQLKQKLAKEKTEYVSWEDTVFLKQDFKSCVVINKSANK